MNEMPSGAQNINMNDATHDRTQSLIVSIVLRFNSGGTEFAGTVWSTSWPWKMSVWNYWSSDAAACPRRSASSITCLC